MSDKGRQTGRVADQPACVPAGMEHIESSESKRETNDSHLINFIGICEQIEDFLLAQQMGQAARDDRRIGIAVLCLVDLIFELKYKMRNGRFFKYNSKDSQTITSTLLPRIIRIIIKRDLLFISSTEKQCTNLWQHYAFSLTLILYRNDRKWTELTNLILKVLIRPATDLLSALSAQCLYRTFGM